MKFKLFLLIVSAGLVAALLAPQVFATPPAPDQTGNLSTEDAMLAKALTWEVCTPARVATFANRVHVRCTAPINGITYFAASTRDPAYAARVLSIVTAALVTGRDLEIFYDPADTSGTAVGCQAADCRLIVGVGTLH